MATVYARQIATAKRLIAAKGQLVTWRKIPDGVLPDSNMPWKPGAGGAPVDVNVKIVFFPYTRTNMQLMRALLPNAPEILVGNMYGLMASVDFVPSKVDLILRGSRQIRINAIDELSPDGTPILYTLDLTD